MKVAFLYPGQGAQYAGMGRELYERHPEVRDTFAEASDVLGYDLSRLVFDDPEGVLRLTEYAQPAILTLSVACHRLLEARGFTPDYGAGLSLGEYTALVGAKALPFAQAVWLVRRRGRYMQEAVAAGEGAMAAILGLSDDEVQALCREIEGVEPANYNCPGQVVVSGQVTAVRELMERARAAAARKVALLEVSAPFHSRYMRPAAERLRPDLQEVDFRRARYPVISNVDAAELSEPEAIRRALYRQMTSPVRWTEVAQKLAASGVRLMIELGPGTVLAGFQRRIDRGVRVLSFPEKVGLDDLVRELEVFSG